MPSPFPGMDPYLENPEIWSEVHHWLLTGIAEFLVGQLRPKYRVAVEKRIYQTTDETSLLVGIPDVIVAKAIPTGRAGSSTAIATPPQPVTVNLPMPEEVRESYLEVREVGTGEVITTIEVLSPKNKRSGEGRNAYETKRRRILGSLTHLVEIDLLRAGTPMTILNPTISSQYRILVSRSDRRPSADLYAFNLPDSIPIFSLPLQRQDMEPLVNLQVILQSIYDRAGFDLAINYDRSAVPPLTGEDLAWAEKIIELGRENIAGT